MVVSIGNAEHYIWGEICDGWHLLKRGDMSVIQEHVPPGGAEVMHYHSQARQFFYILEGEGIMLFEEKGWAGNSTTSQTSIHESIG